MLCIKLCPAINHQLRIKEEEIYNMPRIGQQVRGIYNKNIKTSYMAIVNNEQRELQT